MLKLDLNLTKEQKTVRLGKIRDRFATYFGFVTSGSIAEALALNQVISDINPTTGNPGSAGADQLRQSRARAGARALIDSRAKRVFEIFLDAGNGAFKTFLDQSVTEEVARNNSIIGKLEQTLQGTGGSDEYKKYIEIHYCDAASNNNGGIFHNDLGTIGFDDTGGSLQEDAKKKLSAFRMQHPLLAPGERNADLLTVFFNAFPTLELVRATPVLDVRMYSSRQVFQDGKLAAISLQKFLEGAVDAPEGTNQNSALRAIGLASQITASAFGNTDLNFTDYSITGMELFRAPQTMVNPDATRVRNNFLAPIIDPFRPLASIKSLDVEVRSAVGLISTKTAKLEIVLHDRSRMGEFADMIKPDRFGTSFVDVEYGWSHPDQVEDDANSLNGNPYADILNLTRAKEHYNITNSSFSFDEVGQVNITLSLVTRGVSEMAELSITSRQDPVKSQITELEKLSKVINRLSAIVFGNGNESQNSSTHTHRAEIRGNQALGAVGDSTNMLVVSGELMRSLAQLRDTLSGPNVNGSSSSTARRAAAAQMRTAINDIIGPPTSRNVTTPAVVASNRPPQVAARPARTVRRNTGIQEVGGVITRIQRTVNSDIRTSLSNINGSSEPDDFTADIFLKTMPNLPKDFFNTINNRSRTVVLGGVSGENRTNIQNENAQFNTFSDNIGERPIRHVLSLGTVFMSFVAKPLASMEDKFEEVQVYFYNFNNKASVMSHCNISQFPIYTEFFAREYSRLRLENMNRSVNLSVVEFVGFLANKMVDDPLNPAYGINDIYRLGEDGRTLEIVGAGRNDEQKQDDFNEKMRTKMERYNIGKSPDFQMPQITVDLEALPYSENPNKTILKIHVYDKSCSTKGPLRELLSLSTENLMAQLSSFPADEQAQQAFQDQRDPGQPTQRRSRHHGAAGHRSTRQAANIAQPADEVITGDTLRQNWREIYSNTINQAIDLKLIRSVSEEESSRNREGVNINTVNPQYRFIGGPKRLKEMVMQYVPHIIYGCMGTTVKTANLSTQQNAQLATINMQRSLNADPVLANGEQAGGVPLSVYPCELSITTLGCPFIRHSQEIFVDFNTNTTADNIYYVTGLSHKIEAGNYETTIKLTPNDAFAQYRNMISQFNNASIFLSDTLSRGNNTPNPTTTQQQQQQPSNR